MRNSVIIPVSSGGGSVPVVAAPQGSFYAAIAYFTGENGDYDNYAYAYVNDQLEFNAQFCSNAVGSRANFELSPTPGGSDKVSIATSRMFGFYFGGELDMTTLNSLFLARCYSFNQPLVLPEGITLIGYGFLFGCTGFNSNITLPESLTNIGDAFLLGCYSFNRPLVLPSGITRLGNQFMQTCYAFNLELTLPAGITGIGNTFMNNCLSFGRLVANCNAWPVDGSSLATSEVGAGMYVNGVIVEGDYASEWKAGLPDSAVSPYRKLILGPVLLPETSALLARMEQQPSVEVRNLIDKTISDMKDAGIWDLVKRLYCRRSHTMQAALLDWKGLSDGTVHNSVGFRPGYGVKGDGSAAYINNNWMPSEVLTNNACGYFLDIVTPSTGSNNYAFGSWRGTDQYFNARFYGSYRIYTLGGGASDSVQLSGNTPAFYAAQRIDPQSIESFVNGTGKTVTDVANTGSLPSVSITSLAAYNANNVASSFSNAELGWEGYGDVMTDQQQQRLFEIISYYNQQIINLV